MDSTALAHDLVYDVGLHKGEDTAYYLATGYRVVAFEANAELVAFCQRRFKREIESSRLQIIEGAIDVSGVDTVTFYQHPNTVWGTTDPVWAQRNTWLGDSSATSVPATDFEACLRETGVPFFMKVDIEGADKVCFDALRSFEQRPVYVSLESEKVSFAALLGEFHLLESLGYDRFAVVQQAGLPDIAAAHCYDGSRIAYRFEPDASGPFGLDIGPWVSRNSALAHYRSIYRQYRLLGDQAWITRSRVGRSLLARVEGLLSRPLPGWYDTHATRSQDSSVRTPSAST